MNTPFWIAHHAEEDRCRCVRLGGLDFCARCLGLYPALFALIAAQLVTRAPGPQAGEGWLIAASTFPALFDWARGRFDPKSGNNALRIVSGLLLACALSRTIWFHMMAPMNAASVAHLTWILVSALLVEIAAARHRRHARLAEELGEMGQDPEALEALYAGRELPDEAIADMGARVSSPEDTGADLPESASTPSRERNAAGLADSGEASASSDESPVSAARAEVTPADAASPDAGKAAETDAST